MKKGLSELTLRRPRSSIIEVKSALLVPLFRLFEFLRFTCFKLFLLCVSVTFG